MSFFCLNKSKYRPSKKAYKQLQKQETKPIRRTICRVNEDSGDNNSVQRESESESKQKSASAACCCCSQNKTTVVSKQGLTLKDFENTFPQFGPAYKKDPDPFKKFKDDAWSNVMNKSSAEGESSCGGIYLSAIKKIEKDARNSYDPPIVDGLKKSEFQWMMIIDGCFFLQTVIHILGGAELLGYPKDHVYFRSEIKEEEIRKRIKAMFFVGNQIPCVVIRELVKQDFFREVIKQGAEKGLWHMPSNLPKMILYLTVVSPELDSNDKISSPVRSSKLMGKNRIPMFREEPCDILHAMHCLVQGPGIDPIDSESEEYFLDLEAGTEDFNKMNRFPSARELEQKGIRLCKAKQGIREIHFERRFFLWAYLYVPPFTFDEDTDPMLQYLKSYEIQKKFGKSKREVTSYLRFMADLIQTPKDVKILESRGIIQVENEEQKDRLPGMLSRLASSEGTMFTQNLRLARISVEDYSRPPWHLLSLALFLTVVQTIFTILQYLVPRN